MAASKKQRIDGTKIAPEPARTGVLGATGAIDVGTAPTEGGTVGPVDMAGVEIAVGTAAGTGTPAAGGSRGESTKGALTGAAAGATVGAEQAARPT
jgi:hypothetical protein